MTENCRQNRQHSDSPCLASGRRPSAGDSNES